MKSHGIDYWISSGGKIASFNIKKFIEVFECPKISRHIWNI